LVGQPFAFDSAAVYSNITEANSRSPRPPSPQQPQSQPPPAHGLATTAEPLKSKSKPKPKLRTSQSFTALARAKMETITPPRSDSGGTKSPHQRFSDEPDAATKTKNRKSDGGKKKSAFTTFMKEMLGSPRRPTISTPTNPMHVTHVSIDNETGEFTVRDTRQRPRTP
jgi:p21-activated kinase 1